MSKKYSNFAPVIELERHIEILLLDNDCVIVPGLGGFMAHHVEARYEEDEQAFLPPLRTLGFNPQLKINDSLLAQSYIEAYDISYPEALQRIEDEVNELTQILQNEGRYEFRSEVQECVADGRSCAEAATDGCVIISCRNVIAIEEDQDGCAKESADHLGDDIAGNQAPGHTAADGRADGNCGIEVCSGQCAEGERGNHDRHAPADEDVYGIAALHAGFVKADVTANAVTQKYQHTCSN